jgi:prepilin-type N-terminal cleavage/methylation domain-containing protein
MVRSKSRSGFTLIEMMLVVTIFVIVLATVGGTFIGGIRLLKATFATAEMSLQVRTLRERLLFNAAPPHDDTVWAGLLSGTNGTPVLEGNATKILMHCPALKNADGATANQTIQVILKDNGTKKCSFFSEDRYDERWPHRWLNPGGMNLMAGSATTEPLAWARKLDGSEDHTRFYIHLTGQMDAAGLPIKHDERIVVPVFGCQQETRTDGKGGLDR